MIKKTMHSFWSRPCQGEIRQSREGFRTYFILSFCFFEFLTCLPAGRVFPISPVLASNFDLSIDPSLVRIQVKPGKSITKAYTIQNKSESDQILVARVVPFSKSDLNGNPLLDLKAKPNWLNYFGLSNTGIKLNEPFNIKAKSSEQLIFSLSIPEDAPLKDLYATILISTYSNSLPSEQKGSLVSASIGANLLVSITSELNPKTITKINKLTITNGSYFHFGNIFLIDNLSPVSFSGEVSNEGDFATETRGLFRVSKGSSPLYMEGIMPQYLISRSSRQLKSTSNNSFTYKPKITDLGFYIAEFEIKSENTNSQNSLNLFFFPFKAVLAILIGLILLKIISPKS